MPAKLRKRERFFPESLWREPGPADTSISDFQSPELRKNTFFLFFKSLPVVMLCNIKGRKHALAIPSGPQGLGGAPRLQLSSPWTSCGSIVHPALPGLCSRALPPAAPLSLMSPSLHMCWDALHHCWGPGLQYDPVGHSGAHSHT